jgi:hypothetical protein
MPADGSLLVGKAENDDVVVRMFSLEAVDIKPAI